MISIKEENLLSFRFFYVTLVYTIQNYFIVQGIL